MEIVSLLPLLVIVLLFWLMVVRPAARRQKEVARLQDSLQPGHRVMLASGIFGTIRSLTDDRACIDLAPGVEVEVVRGAITSVDQPADAASHPTDPTDPTDATERGGDQP